MIHSLTAAVVVLALGLPGSTEAAAVVTRVWDGDTISVHRDDEELRVRLAGIDAPEHDQRHGDAATARLRALLLDREVTLEGDKRDRYGRLLAKVCVEPPDCPNCGKTLDAGLALVTTGHAWWYRRYQADQSPEDRGRYELAEQKARANRAGLWADSDPTPPWSWPRGERRGGDRPAGCNIKGNISRSGRIYHLPGQAYYDQTRISPSRGERWFCSEAEARAAGWRRAKR